MYQFSYADIQTDSVADAKDRERQLLSRSIDMLTRASAAGTPAGAPAIIPRRNRTKPRSRKRGCTQ